MFVIFFIGRKLLSLQLRIIGMDILTQKRRLYKISMEDGVEFCIPNQGVVNPFSVHINTVVVFLYRIFARTKILIGW